jgi:glycosyltransferase involved in cell wall biosynthesis
MIPYLSIVMAVYNGENDLQQTLESILAQSFNDWELIVIDDKSADATLDIIEQYRKQDTRIRILTNSENLKLAASLNRGIGIAKADWIARHDCGDLSHPQRLQKQVDFLRLHPELILLGTAYTIIAPDGQPLITMPMPTTDGAIRQTMRHQNPFAHGSVIFRKEAFKRVGSYNSSFPAAQDYDLWLRLCQEGQMANLSESLYFWRFDSCSTTLSKYALQYAYIRYAQVQAHLVDDQRSVDSFVLEAPVIENYLNWLLIAVQAENLSVANELVDILWKQYVAIIQGRHYMIAYMVKRGVRLAMDVNMTTAERFVGCFYRDWPQLEAHVMRRIYCRVPQQSFRWELVMRGLHQDLRSWPQLVQLGIRRLFYHL